MDRYLDKESIKLKLVLKDKIPGLPIDIGELLSLSVSVYHAATGTVLEEGEYGTGDDIFVSSESSGIAYFPIEDDLNDGADTGVYRVKVTIQMTDPSFEDGIFTQIRDMKAFKIVSRGNIQREDYTTLTVEFAIGTDLYVDDDLYVDEDYNI